MGRKRATFLMILLVVAVSVYAQPSYIFFDGTSRMGSKLLKYNGKDVVEFFHLPEAYYAQEYYLGYSFSFQFFSILASSRSFIGDGVKEKAYLDMKLVILNQSGGVVVNLPGCQRYSWCPFSEELVYLLGKNYEGFGFGSDSLFIVDCSRRQWNLRIKVPPSLAPHDIAWAAFDSSIYMLCFGKTGGVFRINPINGDMQRTSHEGIYFSSDGKYYMHPNYEGEGIGVYRSDGDISLSLPHSISDRANYVQWLPENRLVLGNVLGPKQVLQIPSMNVVTSFTGKVVGIDSQAKELVIVESAQGKATSASDLKRIRF